MSTINFRHCGVSFSSFIRQPYPKQPYTAKFNPVCSGRLSLPIHNTLRLCRLRVFTFLQKTVNMRVNLEILDYVNSKFRSLRIKTGHYRSLLLVCLLFPLVLLSCSAANNKQQLERPALVKPNKRSYRYLGHFSNSQAS